MYQGKYEGRPMASLTDMPLKGVKYVNIQSNFSLCANSSNSRTSKNYL